MTSLVMTVGTGTAGMHSNLAQGLINSLRLRRPDCYWLVPSASPDSTGIADLIREEIPEGFTRWSEGEPYHCILNHDSIADCRETIRDVIRVARKNSATSVVINPTSGTKQMSAGATLAALDENVAEIQFTVGERVEGVVKTGSERLETFDPSAIFAARDEAIAVDLSQAGAHLAAHRLLQGHSSLQAQAGLALCLHEWERLNYEQARQLATGNNHPALVPVRQHLQTLAAAAKSGKPDATIVADLLETGRAHHRRGDYEASLFQVWKALEMGLRLRLLETTGLSEPYGLAALGELLIGEDRMARLRGISRDKKTCVLGLGQVVDVLKCLSDPMANDYSDDRELSRLVGLRNEFTHSVRHIVGSDAATFVERVSRLLLSHLELPSAPPRPTLRVS